MNYLASNWGEDLSGGVLRVLSYIFMVVGAVGVVYAVYLGFLLAKATDESKRSQAKKRIFNVISGLLIIVILTGVIVAFDWSGAGSGKGSEYNPNNYGLSTYSTNLSWKNSDGTFSLALAYSANGFNNGPGSINWSAFPEQVRSV